MKKLLSSAAAVTLAAGMLFTAPASATVLPTDDPILYWNQLIVSTVPGGPPIQRANRAPDDARPWASHDQLGGQIHQLVHAPGWDPGGTV